MIFEKSKLIEVCKVHAKREEFWKKVETSLEVIKRFYKPERSYVACSGGKDSLALTHLIIHNVDPNVIVFHWNHGRWYIPRWIERDIIECIKAIPVKNLIIKRSRYGENPKCRELSAIKPSFGLRGMYSFIKNVLVKEMRIEVCFLGLRAEESCIRKRRTREYHEFHKGTGTTLVYPLRDWTWLDVWTYIIINNIKYPKIYDIYAKYLGYDKVRLVTFFDKEFEGIGTYYLDQVILWKWKLKP